MQRYILFDSAKDGMALHKRLLAENFRLTIAPTPRQADRCCGISILLLDESQYAAVDDLIKKEQLIHAGYFDMEADVNPKRDRYC